GQIDHGFRSFGGIHISVDPKIGAPVESAALGIEFSEGLFVAGQRTTVALSDSRLNHVKRTIQPNRNAVVTQNFVVRRLYERAAAQCDYSRNATLDLLQPALDRLGL